jgi:MFS superfamily sulfate permease-like transporter
LVRSGSLLCQRRLLHRSGAPSDPPFPTPVRRLVIDARAITDVDFSAGRALAELRRELADSGVVLALVVVSTRREDEVTQSGLVELADATRVFDSREACVAAYLAERAREEDSRFGFQRREGVLIGSRDRI